jgi:hypothetical protein
LAKVSDLIRRFSALVDDTFDNITVVDWFNQCQNNLTDLLYLPTLTTIDKDVSGYFILPSDFNGELKILDPDTIDVYSVYDKSLRFTGSEDITQIEVTYNRLPLAVTTNPEFIPDLPEQFHDIYVFYACMMAMHPEEEPERYSLYEKDYLRARYQLDKYMGKTRPRPKSWVVVR